MQADNFTLSGNIVDQETKQAVIGLRVEAWDRDLIFDDLLGGAETDDAGLFQIYFNEGHFRELIERRPDLYFRLYSNGEEIPGGTFEVTVTSPGGETKSGAGNEVYWQISPGQTQVEIRLLMPVASHGFRVEGTVTQKDGTPVAGVTVRAVDRDLRHEEQLGEDSTDPAGKYTITYNPQQFYRAEKKSADLIVRAYDQDQLLGSSAILFNVPAVATVDLTVDSGLSEFEHINQTLAPLLKIDNVGIADLSDDDIAFLVGETGFEAEWLQILVGAANLASQVDFGLSETDATAVFYGLGRNAQPMDLDELLGRDLYVLRKVLENALDENIIPGYLSASLDAVFETLEQLAEQSGVEKPAHHIDFQQNNLQIIGGFIGLDPSKMNALIERAVTFAGVNDKNLGKLVAEGVLLDEEAKSLGLTVSLYHLLDTNTQLVEALVTGSLTQLPQGAPTEIKDLVVFDKTDWQGLLEQNDITPPDDLTIAAYAAVLTRKIEFLYPSDALMARLIRVDGEALRADMEALRPLFDKNETIIGIDKFDDLDTKGVQTGEIEKLRSPHAKLTGLANSYKGLNLKQIIDNQALSGDDKSMQIADRIGLLSQFHRQNPDKEFLTLEYTPESDDVEGLDFDGFSDEDQQMVLACCKVYQRIYTLSEDIEQSQMIVAAGYDSASAIAGDSQENFHSNTGMTQADTESNYHYSVAIAENAALQTGAVIDAVQGGYDWFVPSNQLPDIGDYLQKVPGFADLFGSQDYCRCRHCQSILSPVAYFVDLMSFIEYKILSVNFDGDLQGHVLNLKTRRPDLWGLPLTCENTHGLLPYLEIIDEILENHIYLAAHADAAGELPERDEIETYVYQNVINVDKDFIRSFRQPLLLALEKLEIYLSHFDVSRGEIARLLEVESAQIAAATLSLSASEYQLVIEAKEDPVFLERLYGIDFEIDTGSGSVTRFDAQMLLSPMGLTRSELGELVATHYVQSSSPDQIQILGGKLDPDLDVQNNVEMILGLTTGSLDQMHRFIRLWRQLSWSIAELDLVIMHMQDEELSNGIDAYLPPHLTTLLDIQRRFGISVEELCTLWSDIPRRRITDEGEALFDRLFNLPDFVLLGGNYPKPSIRFYHPAFQHEGPEENNHIHRLLAGLRIDDEQLYLLITGLSAPLGLNLDNEGLDYQTGFLLSVDNLSLLYRHARLAQWLKIEIAQLFQLIDQAQTVEQGHIGSLNELSALLRYHDWLKSADYSADDIAYVTQTGPYPEAEGLAKQLLDDIEAAGALTFADSVFAYLENITEEQSKIIIETNSGWIANVTESSLYWLSELFNPSMLTESMAGLEFSRTIFTLLEGVNAEQSGLIVDANSDFLEEAVGQGYRLKLVFNPDSELVIPAGIDVAETDARTLLIAYFDLSRAENLTSLLMAYHASEVVSAYLAGQLGIAVEKSRALIKMTGVETGSSDFVSALQSRGSEIRDLVGLVLPLEITFHAKAFKADSIDFIYANREQAEIFDISDINSLGIVNLQRISLYAGFLPESGTDNHLPGLHEVLVAFDVAFDPEDKFANADNAMLAAVLNTDPALVLTLKTQISLPVTALEALDKLRRCVELVKYLGVGSEALDLIVAEDYDALAQGGDAILAAFRAKYSDEAEWNEKVRPYRDKIRTIKRDALTDYMIHSSDYAWCQSHDDLYYYFLLDVELEGCASTSRIVAAISSLQLYVHRVLMNLEQSADGDIQVKPDEPEIFVREWEWRKNYRVWETNRKVFLYPENWIEPGLRDNKTPLFEALESELLQQEINEQTVLDAYANYMRGFEEVANLKIAGAYHEKDRQNKQDTLHLFGVTVDEPPVYYYRGIENAHYGERRNDRGIVWSPWRKIDVQIPVTKVSPIVFRGRLHLFWVEITTRPKNEVSNGGSQFVGYQHKMALKYTNLRLDGSWTTPQRIRLDGVIPFDSGDGIVEDPLYEPGEGTIIWTGAPTQAAAQLSYFKQEIPNYEFLIRYVDSVAQIIIELPPAHFTIPKYDDERHSEPMDGYTLSGYLWDQIYPAVYVDDEGVERLKITGRGWEVVSAPVDFYRRELKSSRLNLFANAGEDEIGFFFYRILYSLDGSLSYLCPVSSFLDRYAYASLLIENERLIDLYLRISNPEIKSLIETIQASLLESGTKIAVLNEDDALAPVAGSIEDIIIDSNGDLLLLQSLGGQGVTHLLKRLGTTLSEKVSRTLLTQGVNGLLHTDMQKGLIENPSPISKTDNHIDEHYLQDAIDAEMPDFKGAFGTYFREIFFHIPFLIANHLNSQQKFSAAQKWYHYIFDPTANEEIDVFGSGPTPGPGEAEKRQRDSNWRYIEFRGLGIDRLLNILTDTPAIEAYRKNPFNPHAIARLRLTAYQKTIVTKYIDNLLDWGDQLFAQDTMESINEATLLYILASDILGRRPAELGDCAEIPLGLRTYESIKPLLNEDSPFLIEMEHLVASGHAANFGSVSYEYSIDAALANNASESAHMTTIDSALGMQSMSMRSAAGTEPGMGNSPAMKSASAGQAMRRVGMAAAVDWSQANQVYEENQPQGWVEMVEQITAVFCIPENKGLKQYWDRVEDRLYKIRNCMNLSGVRRQLALFAPEIDPGLLVRAKAAGLSLEDVLNAISGNLPPYRFAYVIDKAKSYASMVQGFGAALLSALEKKDAEELTLLRAVHEQNIMKMTRQVRQWEINAARESIEGLRRRQKTVLHRRDYYQSLLDEGLTTWETAQEGSRHTVSLSRAAQEMLLVAAGIAYTLPQVGSPFAMKYGGQEIGRGFHLAGWALGTAGKLAEAVAASAGLEATFERRSQGWEHQLEQTDHELQELEKQMITAEIQQDLAERSLEIHQKSIDQLDEVYEYYGEKFSNLGLYTWLSTTLQRLYREAYNSAYSMARLAEQTYRYERSDDTSELLGSGHWHAERAGLLAGDRLNIDLQNLERKFIETNYRSLEVNQTFSLAQIAPDALITLRETGVCEFGVAEVFFDLFYPGHYRRKIKSARLTIPCVTGPYTNVGATLRLVNSSIRLTPETGDDVPQAVPGTRTLAIATSSAQNDAGVFEFNFRDERYMPFEGAGAISNWKLSLPKNFRQFDYQTISDVLVHISYTAEEDGLLGERIEAQNAEIEGSISAFLSENALPGAFSLAHDFSGEFNRLIHSPIGDSVTIELADAHLPIFLRNRNIEIVDAKLCLQVPVGQSTAGFGISINDETPFAEFTPDDSFGGLPSCDVADVFSGSLTGEYQFSIDEAGELITQPDTVLEDILLYFTYKIIP